MTIWPSLSRCTDSPKVTPTVVDMDRQQLKDIKHRKGRTVVVKKEDTGKNRKGDINPHHLRAATTHRPNKRTVEVGPSMDHKGKGGGNMSRLRVVTSHQPNKAIVKAKVEVDMVLLNRGEMTTNRLRVKAGIRRRPRHGMEVSVL